ncbi:MAG: PAS domain S-box protein [Ignavibacteriales bacterium]|nr:PAS domain S-box protein [Ignavibacteriales bacterium]
MVDLVNLSSEGFVDYMWQWKDDSTRIVPKLSHVKKFEQWGWVIGTGIYLEDVREEVKELESNIITISILITLLSSSFLFFMAFMSYKSEKKRAVAEEELKESREKYRMLVETSGEGLIMILENDQVYFNKTIYTILGYEYEEIDLRLEEIFPVPPASKIFDFKSQRFIKSSETTEQFECKIQNKGGEFIDIFLNISQIVFISSPGIVLSIKDISRHKEIEEELDFSREKYLALTNRLTIGVLRTANGDKLHISEINPAGVNLLGASSNQELINSSLFDYFVDSSICASIITDLNSTGFVKNVPVQLKQTEGKIITVSLSLVASKSLNGEPVMIDGIIEDITEQQRTDRDKSELIHDLQSSVLPLFQKISHFIKKIPVCGYDEPVDRAIEIMNGNNSGSLLILSEKKEAIGIFTEHDLIERVLDKEGTLKEPVFKYMSSPVYKIQSDCSIIEALNLFRKKKIKRLIVQSGNKYEGYISSDEIFEASYSNFLFFIKNIEDATNIEQIILSKNRLQILISGLVESNSNAHNITNFITLIANTVNNRIIEIAIKESGEPPVKFAFLTMGSVGREEQTLATDQDNAIVFEDVSDDLLISTRNYFLLLGEKISNYLALCGYEFCPGLIMAKNEKWVQPFSVWKKYFTEWITESSPQNLLDIKIFFDLRPVYGDLDLGKKLQEHFYFAAISYRPFFIFMCGSVKNNSLPESMMKLKSNPDIKLLLLPVVDFARIYAIKYKFQDQNTFKRLELIYSQGLISYTLYKNIVYFYNYLMNLRLKHQIECIEANLEISNKVPLQSLTETDLLLLKRYFDVLEELRNKITLDFK